MKKGFFSAAVLFFTLACESAGDITGDGRADSPPPAGPCPGSFDPRNPTFKMTGVDFVAPWTIDSAVMENFITEAMAGDGCVLLLAFSGVDGGSADADGSLELRIGAGEPAGEAGELPCYRFAGSGPYEPADLVLADTGGIFSTPADAEGASFDVPVYLEEVRSGERMHIITLPLRDFYIETAALGDDGASTGCECSAVCGGVITVEDARGQVIESMGRTLCGLLSGDKGKDPADPADDCIIESERWLNPPDARFGGAPAFSVRARFCASNVVIIP